MINKRLIKIIAIALALVGTPIAECMLGDNIQKVSLIGVERASADDSIELKVRDGYDVYATENIGSVEVEYSNFNNFKSESFGGIYHAWNFGDNIWALMIGDSRVILKDMKSNTEIARTPDSSLSSANIKFAGLDASELKTKGTVKVSINLSGSNYTNFEITKSGITQLGTAAYPVGHNVEKDKSMPDIGYNQGYSETSDGNTTLRIFESNGEKIIAYLVEGRYTLDSRIVTNIYGSYDNSPNRIYYRIKDKNTVEPYKYSIKDSKNYTIPSSITVGGAVMSVDCADSAVFDSLNFASYSPVIGHYGYDKSTASSIVSNAKKVELMDKNYNVAYTMYCKTGSNITQYMPSSINGISVPIWQQLDGIYSSNISSSCRFYSPTLDSSISTKPIAPILTISKENPSNREDVTIGIS